MEPGGTVWVFLAVTASATWMLVWVTMRLSVEIGKSETQKLLQRLSSLALHGRSIGADVEVAAQKTLPVDVTLGLNVVP